MSEIEKHWVRYKVSYGSATQKFKFAGPYCIHEAELQKADISGYMGITDVSITTRGPK